MTAAESGTYTDFANINLGGLLPDGSDGSNEVSHLLLDIIDEMHLLQPSSNLQLSRKTPDALAQARPARDPQGLRLPVDLQRRRRGRGAAPPGQDAGGRPGRRVQRLRRDRAPSARRPTSSPATSTWSRSSNWRCTTASIRGPASSLGPRPATPDAFATFDDLFAAFRRQLQHFLDIKIARQPAHRADVRRADARPVPLGPHRRLHPQGQGLQRRRRPLQQQLHPVRRHRQPDRQPRGRQAAGVRRAGD